VTSTLIVLVAREDLFCPVRPAGRAGASFLPVSREAHRERGATVVRRLLSLVAAAAVGVGLALLPAGAALAAPSPVSGLTAVPGETQVALSWVLPVPAPAQVLVREAVGAVPPATLGDGVPVALATTSSAVATGLAYGQQYSFSVFTSDGTNVAGPVSVTSAPQGASSLSIGVHPAVLTFGTKTEVSGRLRRGIDQVPVAGEKITLYQRRTGQATWVGWASALTAGDGTVKFPVSFGRNTEFELVHSASVFYGASTSKVAPLVVNPRLTIDVPSIAKSYDTVVVSGALSPAAKQPIYLQRWANGWKTILSGSTGNSGKYRFALHPTVKVNYQLRVWMPATATRGPLVSAKTKTTVDDRDLRQGLRGPDVLAVQQRLAVLHYDTGAVNGTFSYDTTHAVIAFEKVQGLPRDGVVTRTVLKALAKPKVPHVFFPIAGREFEVNKSRQVVLMTEGGQIKRIIDASTGFGGNYVYAHVTYQAITPEGNYRIQRKINAVRVSHLGVLYRPAYFFDGYAIHGEGLVPPYPASHGCVRITVPAMDRLYDLLVIGTPVHIYH
jgi:N-acetylmuramoyl-L-alanine amidase